MLYSLHHVWCGTSRGKQRYSYSPKHEAISCLQKYNCSQMRSSSSLHIPSCSPSSSAVGTVRSTLPYMHTWRSQYPPLANGHQRQIAACSATAQASAPPDMAVHVRNLRLDLGPRDAKQPVLRGVNLDLKRGSLHMLLGPNGCGKD